jgi:hypothetical protein
MTKSVAMRKCPKCGHNSLGYNMKDQEQCIYKSCAWINVDNVNLDNAKAVKELLKTIGTATGGRKSSTRVISGSIPLL